MCSNGVARQPVLLQAVEHAEQYVVMTMSHSSIAGCYGSLT